MAKDFNHNEIGTSGVVVPNADGTINTGEYPIAPDIQPPSGVDPLADKPAPIRKRLTGADVRKIRDSVSEDVDVEGWDGFITIKALTAKERDDFESSVLVKKGTGKAATREFSNANIRAKLVVKCAVDEYGHRIWTDEDADWLGDKDAKAVDALYAVAARLSGITEADAEDMEKNSKSVAGDDS